MQQENSPLVSIICTSYNHEKFIKECLDGFVMQQTNFVFEIIVHDDASTDETQKIVKDYESKFPYLFNNIYQTENHYSKKEVNIWYDIMFPKARGKYIAICEGDDYWTDPLKLQKQVNFLEKNDGYGLVCTNFKLYFEESDKFIINKYSKLFEDISFKSLLKGDFHVGTATVCFRKDFYKSYIQEIATDSKDWLMGDFPLWMYISQKSKIYYLNEICSVYRVIEESASHSKEIEKLMEFENSVREIKHYFLNKFDSKGIQLRHEIETFYLYRKIAANVAAKGNISQFMGFMIKFYAVNRSWLLFKGSLNQILSKVKTF